MSLRESPSKRYTSRTDNAMARWGDVQALLNDETTFDELSLLPDSNDDAIDVTGTYMTTASVLDADMSAHISGQVIDIALDTTTVQADADIIRITDSRNHDDSAADAYRGVTVENSGNFAGTKASTTYLLNGEYSGTVNGSATLYAVRGDLSSATLTGGTYAGGYFSDGTQTVALADGTSHIDATTSLVTNMPVPSVGADISGVANATTKWIPSGKKGSSGMKVTEFYIDLTDLDSVATDGDAIGENGETTSATLGQYTTAVHGTIEAIEMVCLEVPASGAVDIDLYSHATGTLSYDDDVSGGDQLINAGGAWSNGDVKGATSLPTSDHYFYLTSGAATAGAYTQGKFIIRVYGS